MLVRILTAVCAVVTLSAGALLVRVVVDVKTNNALASQVAALTSKAAAGNACLSDEAQRRAAARAWAESRNIAPGLGRIRGVPNL
jgi:hypothetical protein